LTEGLLAGTFRLEQLPVGRTYTVTYEAPGFQTLTEQIELTITTPEREISMVRSTGRLRGKVTITGSSLSPTAVAVTVTNPDNTYKTTDAISSDGSLLVDGIVPGAYVVIFEALGLEKQVREVDIGAGTSTELNVTLAATRTSPVKSSLSFKVVKGGNDTTTTVSATVRFRADGDCGSVGADSDCTYDVTLADGNLVITGLEAGGYVIDFTAEGFASQRITAQVAASTDAPQREIEMIPLGSLQGLVTDDTSAPIQGLQLGLYRDTTLIATTTTSASGEFLFSKKLDAETYNIKVTGAGFLPVERSIVGALSATLNLDVTVRGKSLITGEVRSLDLLTGNFQAVEGSKFTIYFRQNLAPSNGQWIDAATLGLSKSLGGYRLAVEPNSDPDATPPVSDPVIDVCVVASIETATLSAFTPTACDSSVTGLTSRKSTGISIELDETVTRSFYFSPTPGEVDGRVTIGSVAEAGVKVEARRIDSDGRVLESSSTVTDANGDFQFTALTPVRPTPSDGDFSDETNCNLGEGTCWVIRASDEGTGFADSDALTVYPGRSIDITATPIDIVKAGGVYNVTFTDDRGDELADVTALVYPKATPPSPAWDGTCTGQLPALCKTSTNANATLSFPGLDPREYTVEARADDYRDFRTSFTITQGGAVDQIHKLSATKGGLLVDVRTLAGDAIVGATVTVSASSPVLTCDTDNSGTCQIDDIPEGVRTLVVSAPGYPDTNVVATVIGGQTLGTSVVVGSSSGSLRMSVVSSTGGSITGAVFTVDVGGQTFTCTDGVGADAADGACTIAGLSAGSLATVTASVSNYRSATATIGIGSGASAISMVLTPARGATFTITDGSSPLLGATVTATDSTGRTESCTDGAGIETLDGSCAIDNLAAGPLNVVVSLGGYETRTLTVSIVADQSATFEIRLIASSTTFRGRVSSAGSPVNGASVVIVKGATTNSTTTDSSGDFVFTNVAAGTWTATVSATGYLTTSRSSIELTVGTITTQDFVLAASAGSVEFTIKTSGGTPITGIDVTVSASPARSARSDGNGLVSIGDLDAGAYTVTVVDSQTPARFAPQSFVVNVERGYTTRLPVYMGSTKSVVVIGVAGIPASGFGPQTPLAVTVGLDPGGPDPVITSSAVIGFAGADRAIATFTEVPDDTYSLTIDGVSSGPVVVGGLTYEMTANSITTSGPSTFDAGLLLLPRSTVDVQITVEAGADDSGVSVTLSNGYLLGPTSSMTDGSGVASFNGIAPGTYSLRLTKSGVASVDTTITVPDRSAGPTYSPATFTLTDVAPVQITYTAKTSDAVLLPGATIRITEDNIACTTSSTGTCSLLLAPGTWTLLASHPNHPSVSGSITVIAGTPQSIDVNFASASTGDIDFTIEDTSGTAISGASVVLAGNTGVNCTTDVNGECSILARPSTVQTYRVSASGHATGFISVLPLPGTTVSATVQLPVVTPDPTTSALTFRTIDGSTGAALGSVLVEDVDDPANPTTICTTDASTGACTPSTQDVGLLNVRASLSGYVTTSATITVDTNSANTVVLALQPEEPDPATTASLAVTVIDEIGAAVNGVAVSVESGSSCTASNSCTITGITTGATTVTITPSTNHRSKTVVAGLTFGQTTNITVTVHRTGWVRIEVASSPTTSATFAVIGFGTLCIISNPNVACNGPTGQRGLPFGDWLISGEGYANSSVSISASTLYTVTMSASP
jgi:protocatechuate 3,4-dioxygenase beta subunit